MAERVPAKKAAAKKSAASKAAAKKVVAKKAVAKKAVAKRAVAKRATPRKESAAAAPPAADVPADDVLESAAPPLPAPPVGAAAPSGEPPPTIVERLLQLDWASTARIAIPTVLALVAFACVVLTPALMFDNDGDTLNIGPQSRPPVDDFFQYVAMLSAMAMNATVGFKGGHFSVIPLTITVLVLTVYAGLSRRYVTRASTAETIGRLLRASLLFAVLATIVAAFGRFSFRDGDDRTTISASPALAFVWAFLLTALVGIAVVYGPVWVARLRSDEALWPRLRPWRLPLQGGLVALATAIVLGGVSFIIALFVEVVREDGNALDVIKILPAIFGYFVNIGVTMAGLAMGDSVSATAGAFGEEGDASFGYAHLHGASPGYFLLLALPVVATLVGIYWMVRHRQDESLRDLSRACYRMAVPFALGWFFLALVSRAEIGAGGVAGAHVGPQLLLGLGLALGWPGVVGAIAGQLLLRRGDSLTPPPSPRTLRRSRLDQLSWTQVAGGSLAIIVATAIAATARHEDSQRTGGLFDSLRGGVTTEPRAATPSPPGFSNPFGDSRARSVLLSAALSERSYHSRTDTYTADISALGVFVPDGIGFQIESADSTRFCMTATAHETGNTFSYDSGVGSVQEGDSC